MAEAQLSPGGDRGARGATFIGGDPLRAVGALWVFVLHCCWTAGLQTWTPGHGLGALPAHIIVRVAESGPAGVYLFFALSGYLLARPFLRAFIDGSPSPLVLPYLRNRALRIMPALLALVVLELVLFGAKGTSPARLAAVPLFAQIYFPSHFSALMPHAWTIDDEVAFYLLLPLGVPLLRSIGGGLTPRRRAMLVVSACALVAVVSLGFAAMQPAAQENHRGEWLPMIACAFTPGIALAALEQVWGRRMRGGRRGRHLALILVALGVVCFALYVHVAPHPVLWVMYLLATAGSGLVVGGTLVRQWTVGTCWRVLDNRILHWIGRRSYSLYLFHWPVLQLMMLHFSQGYGLGAFARVVLLASAIMVPVSALGYELIERPFLSRRRQWGRGKALDPIAQARGSGLNSSSPARAG